MVIKMKQIIENLKQQTGVSKDYIYRHFTIDKVELDLIFNEVLTSSDNINDFIWGKAVNNIAINSACAIARLNIGSFLSEPKGWFITEQCIREVIAVANAKGIKLNFDTVTESIQKNTIPKFGSHYPSTAQDVMNKKTTEIETLNGAIVKYGKQLGIPTPYNECVAAFIQVIQNHYSDMF